MIFSRIPRPGGGFCTRICPPFYSATENEPFLITLERDEGRMEQGLKMGKGNSSKVNVTQGFVTLGHSNWAICSLLN